MFQLELKFSLLLKFQSFLSVQSFVFVLNLCQYNFLSQVMRLKIDLKVSSLFTNLPKKFFLFFFRNQLQQQTSQQILTFKESDKTDFLTNLPKQQQSKGSLTTTIFISFEKKLHDGEIFFLFLNAEFKKCFKNCDLFHDKQAFNSGSN